MRKHETAVCGTARTVVWEVGKCENRRQMPFMISIYLLPNFMQVWGGDYMGSLDKPGRAVDYIMGLT